VAVVVVVADVVVIGWVVVVLVVAVDVVVFVVVDVVVALEHDARSMAATSKKLKPNQVNLFFNSLLLFTNI